MMTTRERIRPWMIATAVVAGAVALVAYWGQINDTLNAIDPETVRMWVLQAGPAGPLAIVALMTFAIVASPIPSAPIALAAGLIYGHLWGTVLVVIGAELGAIAAFVIARHLGRDRIERLLGDRMQNRFLGSQNALMATVFASRLLPFVSFDIISYAAGLSQITFWRFGLATLAGIVPASFVLAHLGAESLEGQANTGFWISLALGGAGLLTAAVMHHRNKRGSGHRSTEGIAK